jgi:hypothetical protein
MVDTSDNNEKIGPLGSRKSRREFISFSSASLLGLFAPGIVFAKPKFDILVTTIITLPNPKMTEEEFYENQKEWVNHKEFKKLKEEFLRKGYMSEIIDVRVENGRYSLTRKFKSKVIFDLWLSRMKKIVDYKKLAKRNMRLIHKFK